MDRSACAVCSRAKLPQLQASLSGHIDCLMKTLDKAGLLDKKGRWEALETDDFGATALHLASRRNQIDALRCLVKHGHVVESVRAQNGASALHDAAATGSLECMRYLVGHSNNSVLDRDANGSTPLHWAVQAGKVEGVVWLVEGAEAPIDARTNTGVTPVHFAAAKNQLKILQFLTSYERAKTGQLKTASMQANNGATPAYFASQEGNLECLRFLVEKCASDPQMAASDGMRCAHAAAQEGHLACLKWLICNANQSAKQRSSDGATPGHFAATQGHIGILRWLLECTDATGEELDNYGGTLAHDGAEQGQLGSLKYLHEQGISLNRLDDDGNSPLTLAEAGGHVQCVEFLKRAMLEKREPRAKLSILDRVAQTGYGMPLGVDMTDDELGISQATLDGVGSSDENLLDGGSDAVDGTEKQQRELQEHAVARRTARDKEMVQKEREEAEERERAAEDKRIAYEALREAEENAMNEHKEKRRALELLERQQKQVALERESELDEGTSGSGRKISVQIKEGNTLRRVQDANLLQAQIDRAKAEEKQHLEMWRRKVAEVAMATEGENDEDDADGTMGASFDETMSEIPDDLDIAAEQEVETSAEKKARKKAEKEKRKTESKEKNRTLKKIGKLIRRQSEREPKDRERSSSEPVPADLSPMSDPTGDSMPGSETASLADESMSGRRRGFSDGAVDPGEALTKAQAKGMVRNRRSQFEFKQADRDRKVGSFSRWRKKSGRKASSLPTTPEQYGIPDAPPAPALEDLLPSGAVTPSEGDTLSPRRRSLASRFGMSLSNLALSMTSLLTIGSTQTSPKPSRSVSFSDLKSHDGSSGEMSPDQSHGDDRMTAGLSLASSRSRRSSEADDDPELESPMKSSGYMPSSLQRRLSEALQALGPGEQEDVHRLYATRTPKSSVDEAMFIQQVEEIAASRKSSRDEGAAAAARMVESSPTVSPMKESQKATLDEALRLALGTENGQRTTAPRRLSLEDALTSSSAAEQRERSESFGNQDSKPAKDGMDQGRPSSLEDVLRMSGESSMMSGNAAVPRAKPEATALEEQIVTIPGAPHVAEPMSPVRGSWSEDKFPGYAPDKLMAALQMALGQQDSDTPSAAAQWLQSPRNRLSPPDDIHDSLMQMMLAPRNVTSSQLIAKLGTDQSLARGTVPGIPPPPPALPPPVLLPSEGVAEGMEGGIPPPPPPPMLPDFGAAEEKSIVFLDPIEEATEREEEEDLKLMQSLQVHGKQELRKTRQALIAMIDSEIEEKERQEREDAATKELLQQQIREEQRRQSEKHRENQQAMQGRKNRVTAKSPVDGVARQGQAAVHPLRRTDTPRVLTTSAPAKPVNPNRPTMAQVALRYRKIKMQKYFDAWFNHVRDRKLLIIRIHIFMENKARGLMLKCFLAWIQYRNFEKAQQFHELRAVQHHRKHTLRKALEGWCTVCGISDASKARGQRQKLQQNLDGNREALLSWMNGYLPSDRKASNLSSDLANGLLVSMLLQAVSGKQAPRLVQKPRLPVQKLDNWRAIQGFMETLGMGQQRQQLQGLVDGDEYWTQDVLQRTRRWQKSRG